MLMVSFKAVEMRLMLNVLAIGNVIVIIRTFIANARKPTVINRTVSAPQRGLFSKLQTDAKSCVNYRVRYLACRILW